MRRNIRLCIWAAAAALGIAQVLGAQAAPAQAADKPQRIVSLDVCADQLLIELVERNRIAAVTHLAADPQVSAVADKAKGLPVTHGAAEDVLRHRPDLILAGEFGVAPTVNLLRRLGANVVVVPVVTDLDGVRGAVRTVAAAVGEAERGEAMVAAFDRRLAGIASAAPAPTARPSALVYEVGGLTSMAGTLADAALAAAGLRNKAADYRLTRGGEVPLELLVASPPDLLVLTNDADDYRTIVVDNLRHPALQRLRQERASIEVPARYWLCGTPSIGEAIARLAQARLRIEAQRR